MKSQKCNWSSGCGNLTRSPSGMCHLHEGRFVQQIASSMTEAMRVGPKLSSGGSGRAGDDSRFSDSPHIEDQVNRAMNGETVEIRVPSNGAEGCTEIYAVNSLGDKGGPFRGSDIAMNTSIQTSSGQRVYAWDYGGKSTHTLKDGSTYSSFVHPCDEAGNNISESLTRDEMLALEAADEVAIDNGFLSNIDPDGELTDEERTNAVFTAMNDYKMHVS